MKSFIKNISNQLTKLEKGFKRFPESILLAYLLVIFQIINIETDFEHEFIRDVVLVLIIGVLLFVNVKLLKSSRFFIGRILVVLIGIGFYFVIPSDLNPGFLTFYISLCTFLLVLFLVIPYFSGKDFLGYYCLLNGLRFFLTVFYCFVLFAGISGLTFAVESLFELDFNETIYLNMMLIAFVGFGVPYFLSTVEKPETVLDIGGYPKGIKLLLTLIVMPLSMAYTLIMYAYFVRVLVTFSWPEGIISHLVLWYGLATWLMMFLLEEISLEKAWQRRWMKIFPVSFILPLVMLLVSCGIRIYYYGFTQARVYLMFTVVWFGIYLGVSFIRKQPKGMVMSIVGMIMIVVTAIGPMSSMNISARSQRNRLVTILEDNNMMEASMVKAKFDLDKSVQDDIMDIMWYLEESDQLEDMDFLPEDFDVTMDMKEVFGFEEYRPRSVRSYYHYEVESFESIPVKDGLVIPLRWRRYNEESSNGVFYINDNHLLSDEYDFRLSLSEIGEQFVEINGDDFDVVQENLLLKYELDEESEVTIVFNTVDIVYEEGVYEFEYGEGFYIIENH